MRELQVAQLKRVRFASRSIINILYAGIRLIKTVTPYQVFQVIIFAVAIFRYLSAFRINFQKESPSFWPLSANREMHLT